MRAVAADEVLRIEEMKQLQIQKKAKPDAEDWKKILQHDALYATIRGNRGSS